MEFFELLGYSLALLIGITLGLIGGGGSVLTVPVFVYLLGITPVTATAYSLFVVGVTSMVGSLSHFKKGLIQIKTALVFALPTVIAIYSTRKFFLPLIPEVLFTIKEFEITKHLFIMILFAVLMVVSSISMITNQKKQNQLHLKGPEFLKLVLPGTGIGILAGLVGAGGGFLIVPALIFWSGLKMKEAIATSLFVITLNSLIGFTGDLGHQTIDWPFLFIFSAIAILGILLGTYLSRYIEGQKLKKVFGWFIMIVGIVILIKELS